MNHSKLQKSLQLMTYLVMILFSINAYAGSPDASVESKLKGEWISPKWNYGFRIDGMVGYAKNWVNKYNPNDKTKDGDIILNIENYTPNGFVGKQLFFNGKRVPIVVTVVDANTIKLEAGPEVWMMVRPK
jgi:hypothetical protein